MPLGTDPLDQRACKYAEYVDETVMGSLPATPAFLPFPGVQTGFEWTADPIFDDYMALNGPTCTTPREHGRSDKIAEDLSFSVTCKPTALTLVPYALMGTTITSYAIDKVPHYQSIGLIMGANYANLKGCLMESMMFNFPGRNKDAELVMKYQALDFSGWGTVDYKGTGSHATPITATPYNFGSLSALTITAGTFAASGMILNSLKFGFENDIEAIEDASSSFSSKCGAYSIGECKKTLELGITFLDAEVYDTIRAAAATNISFTLGTKAFTYTGVKFDKLGSQKANAADALGATLKIKPTVGNFTIV